MPMRRELYPADWEQIALAVKTAARWKCQVCGKQCYGPRQPCLSRKYVLTVAHLDHTPANCDLSNLKAMCAPCHMQYDHARKVRERKYGKLAAGDHQLSIV
jgi:hypothetical protein